ncbi:MAG: PqqD family protein [Planctomycetota bacterium]
MKLRSEVIWTRIGEESGFLHDRRSGGIFGLNRTSATLMEAILSGAGVAELTRRLTSEYDVFELSARGDVLAFVERLRRFDLVEG